MRGAAFVIAVIGACGPVNPPPTATPGSRWLPIDCGAFVEKRAAGVVDFAPSDQLAIPASDGSPKLVPGKRVVGSAQIQPSDFDWTVLRRAHVKVAITAVKVCVDGTGTVRGLQLVLSTGLHEYDRKLCETMQTWRYEPWTVNGSPVDVCTEIKFLFGNQ